MSKNKTARHRAKHLRRGKRPAGGRRAAPVTREDRAMVKLVICGAVFVLLVAVKLLFPQAVGNLAQSTRQLIGQDADFKAAFAAMGRAISGEEDVGGSLQDAYTAVFNPSEVVVEDSNDTSPSYTSARTPFEYPAPETVAAQMVKKLPAEDTETPLPMEEPVRESEPEEVVVDDTVTESMSYVYAMPALPENASLEQRSLGFSYSSPVSGTMTSSFGWRDHPVDGGNKFHYGLDLAADTGTEICAFADGTVYATGESSTLGKYIMLEHAGGYITLYAHCSAVTVTGGSVSMGDKIAEVGETGTATGPHLHFELHDGSLYLNPIYYVEVG